GSNDVHSLSLPDALPISGRAPRGALAAEPDHQPGDHPEFLQPDPLAEPLARGAAELGVLSERLRRPDRAARHADRAVAVVLKERDRKSTRLNSSHGSMSY